MDTSPAARGGALRTLVASGALGFWFGIAAFPEWQVAVETAQVIAGIVTYPPDNPFHIYDVRLFTVLHEIVAVLLGAGVSELSASKLLSGILGMLSLQAMSMLVYAFSRDALFATAAAFVIFLSRAAELGGTYPIHLMGTEHTYGAFGLSAAVLAAGLLGSGCHRAGGLLLGLTPAIHPSMGVWTLAIVGVCLLTGFRTLVPLLRPALPWFIAGCGLSAVSVVVHLAIAPHAVGVDTAGRRYLPTLVRYWDGHRKPPSMDNRAVLLNFASIPLAVAWLLFLRERLPPLSGFLLRFAAVSAVVALGFMFMSWAPPERIPDFLSMLMPLRLLNVASVMFAAIVVGLIGIHRHTLAGQIGMLAVLAALTLAHGSLFWSLMSAATSGSFKEAGPNPIAVLLTAAVGATVFAAIGRRLAVARDGADRGARGATAVAVLRTAAVAAIVMSALLHLRDTKPEALRFRDRTHDPVFSAAAAQEGLLLPGLGFRSIQLRTRRPTLIDPGGFDGLAYSMDAAPAMLGILRDVYQVDPLQRPVESPQKSNRRAWESYSRDRWREIRHKYHVTQVLTDRTWQLDLPLVAETLEMRLYAIPD